ncbi:MAG: hypothetical protein M1839_002152 [Geoglossum umbratile]|nr:MAG: hypothetical protein M1839_002152 [Geoglossum umbratile]
MVGVDHQGLEDVVIFDLPSLDPFDFSNLKPFDFLKPSLSRVQEVQQLKRAYRKLSLITHPDWKGDIAKFKQISQFNEFLFQFNTSCPSIWRRIAELFRRGKDSWASTWNPRLKSDDPGFRKPTPAYIHYSSSRGHVRCPTLASALAKPGSLPSNPIVIDALEIGALAFLAVGPLNRKGTRTKLRRRCRNRRSSYYPSRAPEWRPAPYADQSDPDLGWN